MMESVKDGESEIESLSSVLGMIGARPTLRSDTDTLNALIDDLLDFIHPFGDGSLYSSERRIYRATTEGRSFLTQALRAECIAALDLGVADPEMPVEYRGVTFSGPNICIYFRGGGHTDVGLTIQLTPSWSQFQARLAKQLPTFIERWATRLNASSASVTSSKEGDFVGYFNYVAPDPQWRSEYAPEIYDGDKLREVMIGMVVPVNLGRLSTQLALPIRLLDDVCFLNDTDLIVTRGAVASILTSPITFNLYFDRPLTPTERDRISIAINAWEDEFYSRFDDPYYLPSRLAICDSVVRWTVWAAEGYGRSVDTSGNDINNRALNELRDWLLLLPDISVVELVLGTESVG